MHFPVAIELISAPEGTLLPLRVLCEVQIAKHTEGQLEEWWPLQRTDLYVAWKNSEALQTGGALVRPVRL